MNKRILFVDDEANALEGLREMMQSMHSRWEMEFASGGCEALAVLAQSPVDVVVTDMRMPGMTGADLLDEVKNRNPEVVRILLTGQSDKGSMLQSMGAAHQYLSKPCDAEKLKSVIERALTMRGLLTNDKLRALVSTMKFLPSMPTLYLKVMEELASPNYTLTRVGEIISKDVGMTAKLLQLVNSAFFGLSVRVSNAVYAARLLGPEIIKGLVFSVEAFSKFKRVQSSRLSLEELLEHSMTVASFAKEIAITENQSKEVVDNTFIAAMLHDVGKLVLAENLPDKYGEALKLVEEEGLPLPDAELRVIGATHCEVGGYLLGLWGLPKTAIEASTFHHSPKDAGGTTFSTLTAVHAANALEYELREASDAHRASGMDLEYLYELGLANQLPIWRKACLESKDHLHSD